MKNTRCTSCGPQADFNIDGVGVRVKERTTAEKGRRVQDSLRRSEVNLYTSWVHLDRVRIIDLYIFIYKQGRAKRSPMIDTVRIQEDNRMRAEGNKKASVFY